MTSGNGSKQHSATRMPETPAVSSLENFFPPVTGELIRAPQSSLTFEQKKQLFELEMEKKRNELERERADIALLRAQEFQMRKEAEFVDTAMSCGAELVARVTAERNRMLKECSSKPGQEAHSQFAMRVTIRDL